MRYIDYEHHISEVDCTVPPLLRPDANRARFLSDPYGMLPSDEGQIQTPSRPIGRHLRGPDRPQNMQPARPRAASEIELDPERILSNRREEFTKLFEEMRNKGLADMPEHEGFDHNPEFDSEREFGSERTSSSAIPVEIPTSAGFGGAPRSYGRPNYEEELQKAIQASLEEADTREEAQDIDGMTEEERMMNEVILKSLQDH